MNRAQYQDLLGILLPPKSYNPRGPRLTAELSAEADVLSGADNRAVDVLNGVTPFYAAGLLADWERVLALSSPDDMTYQARRQQVLARLNATGGLSRAYFINLAKSLGYDITIDEPEPFRAGVGRAGDCIWIPEIIWVWIVNIQDGQVPVYHFRAGDSLAGEALTSYGQNLIEDIFRDLKPAHTEVVFNYQENQAS